MASEKLEMDEVFPVDARTLYNAWLTSEQHSAFTGSKAVIEPKAGTAYSAWDGYITGVTKELDTGKCIRQTWRADEFKDSDQDSWLEVTLEDTAKGCHMHLRHWNIPEGLSEQYEEGWREYYFKPMREYFGRK
jgi:activator of HSP90 ATPase